MTAEIVRYFLFISLSSSWTVIVNGSQQQPYKKYDRNNFRIESYINLRKIMENYFQRCASLISLQMDFFLGLFSTFSCFLPFIPFPVFFFLSPPCSLAKSFCLMKIHAFPTHIKLRFSSFLFPLCLWFFIFLTLFSSLPSLQNIWVRKVNKKNLFSFCFICIDILLLMTLLYMVIVRDILFACTYSWFFFREYIIIPRNRSWDYEIRSVLTTRIYVCIEK